MGLTCHEFEQHWNDLLDLRGLPNPEIEAALTAHAASCPSCRDLATGYEALRQTLGNWSAGNANPPPSPALTNRILAARAAETTRTGIPVRLAALAAAVLLAAGLGLLPRVGPPSTPPGAPQYAPSPTLSGSLLTATVATLDLARETSAPAARLGQLVLASSSVSVEAEPFHEPTAAEPAASASSEMLQSVGAGLQPLSGSARNAFGFLLGPAISTPRPASTSHPDA